MRTKLRTEKEIKAEIAALLAIKENPKFRRYSGFGDDHFKAIDIQVSVLERGYDQDDVDERYENSDQHSIASDTVRWREGEEVDEGPVEGWQVLICK
jgi:hypothetical protein